MKFRNTKGVCFFIFVSLAIVTVSAFGRSREEGTLPREFEQISLLISPDAFKRQLHDLGLKIDDEQKGTFPKGLPYHSIMVKSPKKEFHDFTFSFYEGKLFRIRVDYNMEVGINFNDFVSEFKKKFGEPEITDESGQAVGIKAFRYIWRDHKTELQVGFAPPGKDPLGRPYLGALHWQITDNALDQRLKENDERLTLARKKQRRLE